ncbi:hypothetical protein WG66_014578 [Moniliophthora roreri]|nr:hypothetical protein WG66_014578 [Moniliophthora roreri]
MYRHAGSHGREHPSRFKQTHSTYSPLSYPPRHSPNQASQNWALFQQLETRTTKQNWSSPR